MLRAYRLPSRLADPLVPLSRCCLGKNVGFLTDGSRLFGGFFAFSLAPIVELVVVMEDRV
jgi:hypothetical protein